jgi:hypothetical protein
MSISEFLVVVIGGFLLREVLDVWYDGRVLRLVSQVG